MHMYEYEYAYAYVYTLIHWWSLSIAEPVNTLYGHAAAVTSLAMDEVNHQLISCDTDSCVRIWDVKRFVTVQVVDVPGNSPITCLTHDPVNHALLIAHTHPLAYPSLFAQLRKAAAKAAVAPLSPTPDDQADGGGRGGPRDKGLVGAISTEALAVGLAVEESLTVRSYHCADGGSCFRFALEDEQASSGASGMQAGSDAPSAIAFDHSGRRLLVGQRDGKVKVYNFSSGQVPSLPCS